MGKRLFAPFRPNTTVPIRSWAAESREFPASLTRLGFGSNMTCIIYELNQVAAAQPKLKRVPPLPVLPSILWQEKPKNVKTPDGQLKTTALSTNFASRHNIGPPRSESEFAGGGVPVPARPKPWSGRLTTDFFPHAHHKVKDRGYDMKTHRALLPSAKIEPAKSSASLPLMFISQDPTRSLSLTMAANSHDQYRLSKCLW